MDDSERRTLRVALWRAYTDRLEELAGAVPLTLYFLLKDKFRQTHMEDLKQLGLPLEPPPTEWLR